MPSSERTAEDAKRFGITLTDFAAHRRLDLTIDGADQVARGTLDLVKGLGGALLREKMVALASERMVVVADKSKLVDKLGGATPLPIEIVPFGWELTLDRFKAMGATPHLRYAADKPFVTDNGNYIADCSFADIPDPTELDLSLRALFGVRRDGIVLRPRDHGRHRHRQRRRHFASRARLIRYRHCEEARRADAAIQSVSTTGLLRYASNDETAIVA